MNNDGQITAIIECLKRYNATIKTGQAIPLAYICNSVYRGRVYSYEEEKTIISLLISLESQGFIDRTEPKPYYTKALYYLTIKGLDFTE